MRARRLASWLLGISLAAGGCADSAIELMTHADPVTLMSYNLASAGDEPRGRIMAEHIVATGPDFVAAQECAGCDGWILEAMGGLYGVTAGPQAGVAIFYLAAAWAVEDQGVITLGQNDDGWGERVAGFARFSHRESGDSVHVVSTHWCVTIRRSDDLCTVERHLEYAGKLLGHIDRQRRRGLPALIGGDFNVFDGFEDGPVVGLLTDHGLIDVLRVADPDDDGVTFMGNDWAPPGRIDYIFATSPVEVLDAFIDRDSVPDGKGSDHYALVATVHFR